MFNPGLLAGNMAPALYKIGTTASAAASPSISKAITAIPALNSARFKYTKYRDGISDLADHIIEPKVRSNSFLDN